MMMPAFFKFLFTGTVLGYINVNLLNTKYFVFFMPRCILEIKHTHFRNSYSTCLSPNDIPTSARPSHASQSTTPMSHRTYVSLCRRYS